MAEQEDEDFNEFMKHRRTSPMNNLDLAMLTTESVWGKQEVPPELRAQLNKLYSVRGEDGVDKIVPMSLWGNLGFFTRDMRLANIDKMNGEFGACQHYINLAGDFLQSGCPKSFLASLQRSATILELSQSKGGFLRKKMHTFTQEKVLRDEPRKGGFFGGKTSGE